MQLCEMIEACAHPFVPIIPAGGAAALWRAATRREGTSLLAGLAVVDVAARTARNRTDRRALAAAHQSAQHCSGARAARRDLGRAALVPGLLPVERGRA